MSISMNSQSALHEVESRCTQERPPRCQSLCPLGLDARAFLGHAAEGRWSDARKQLERYLPLPGLLARVCDHPCEQGCLRGDLGGAVNLHGLEIFCTEHLGVQTRSLPMPRKQKRIAVIGAGLAGLVCAWDLAGKGYPVTVFHEGDPKAQLLSCWPVLAGAGAAALDAEWEALGRRGVRFEQASTDAACLQQAAGEYEGVLLDAGALPELAPAEDGVDAQILHWRDNICCAGWASVTPTGHRFASASRQAGQGRSAARTLERLVAGVSLTAARDTDERSLYTELDGIAPVERVLPVAEVYSEVEARQEAGRCLQCQCLVCVKACVYLQKYKGYPRVYARQMYNNAAIVKGLHLANNLINGCALCGQCEELCPENFSMAELCLSARQDMVERGVMPPSAHEFALEDMEAASGPECALSIRGGEGGWLFFPGCQLAASRGEQVEALYAWLRDALAGQGEFAPGLERGPVSLLLRCCGIPARWGGREELFSRQAQELRQQWEGLGRPRIMAACSSCLSVLREVLPEARALSLWEVLDALPWPEGTSCGADRGTLLTMQDPCTARHDTAWQDAVRSLARKAGMIPEEPPQGRDRTACCGYGGLVWCAQPELADAMAGHRAGGLPHAALSSCIMCRDRLAGSGKPGLHLLDLLPQLAPLAHGLEPEKGPGLSERRARRAVLRRRLARVWLGQELAEPAAGRLDLVPGLLEELERRHILLEDVDGAVAAVEAEKAYFVDAESGHRLGAWRPRNVTFWVEYTEEDGRWLLHDAWCHRMRVPGSGGVQENGCCGEA